MSEENPENSGEIQEIRDDKGKFVKGVSGNPAGKPVGAKNKVSVIGTIEKMFDDDPAMFLEFVNKYLKDPRNRQHIVEMIDGKPQGSAPQVAVQVNNNSLVTDEQRTEYSIKHLEKLGYKVIKEE